VLTAKEFAMRRFALLVLLLSCAACARKAQPVADGGAPEVPVVFPPVDVKPKKALDANNFAGKSLAQWREDLRSKDRHKIITAMKACEALGPLAVDAVPDILAADIDEPKWDPNFGDRITESRAYWEFQAMKQEVWPGVAKAIGKATIPHLLPLLAVPDEVVKDAAREKAYRAGSALFALGAIGPDAAETIPKLTELVGHTKSGMRDAAARALLDIAGSDKRAVPGLLRALKPDYLVFPRVVDALSRLDPEGTAEQCIAATTVGGSWSTKALTPEVLERFGPKGITAMVAQCKRADGKLNYGPIEALRYMPAELLAPHVSDFVKWIDVAPREWRSFVYSVLGKIGPRAKEAVPRLLELAKGRDLQALAAAARTGATWQQVSEVLRASKGWGTEIPPGKLKLPKSDRKMEAAAAVLPAFGPQIKGELAPFVEMLKTGTPQEKARLAAAILHCDPEHARAVEVLLALQVEADRNEREHHRAAGNNFGEVPKSAVPALKEHLKHTNPRARLLIALAILNLADDPDAARVVGEYLTETMVFIPEDGPQQVQISERFAMLSRAGAVGAQKLGETLKSKIVGERGLAAKALSEMGAGAAPATDALRAAATEEMKPYALGFALRALGNLSTPQKPLALEAARKHLGAGDRWVKFCAAEAVLKCDPSNEDALKALAEFVKPAPEQKWLLWSKELGRSDGDTSAENGKYGLPFGIRGEAVPLLFRLDPERAIRAEAFKTLWFRNYLDQ
jgi:HEAT repeat protein